MIFVHLADGRTFRFETANGEAHEFFSHLEYQAQITAITIQCKGVQHTLSRPQDFKKVLFTYDSVIVAKGAERIRCFSDGTLITLLVHNENAAGRVQVQSMGTRVFNPDEDE